MIQEPFYRSLEHWCGIRPDLPVMIDGDQAITYRELNTRSNQLAQALAIHGVKADDIIVARTHNCLEWAVISQAAGKLDARLLVQNWRLTPDETKHILKDSGAVAFICDDPDLSAIAPALESTHLKVKVAVNGSAKGFEPFNDLLVEEAPERIARRNPPLVVYTSGTTGFPKGVEMRRSLPPLASEHPQPSPEDGASLVNMPVHHASGPNQIWNAMAAGRQVVLVRKFDAEDTLKLIEKHKITHWSGVPTMYKRIAALPQSTIRKYDLSSLKAITIGAAPCAWPLKEWILDTFGEILSEGYGSTETGMVTNMPAKYQRKKPGSSGLPVSGVEIEIRNDDGAILQPGEVGELWVRTPGAIKNYLNAPKLSEKTLDERGFFNVEDKGYLDEDGFLFLTDRSKDMIISGGVNIYPAEIESALLEHPAILDAAVLGAPNEDFGEEVWAFMELKAEAKVSKEELFQHCQEKLASYKIPRKFEFVDELPRNTMGKILKRQLRDPLWAGKDKKI